LTAAVLGLVLALVTAALYATTMRDSGGSTPDNGDRALQIDMNSALATGGGLTEGKFLPIQHCRIVDTRKAGGPLSAGSTRDYYASASAAEVGAQGGNPAGCPIPAYASAISARLTAVGPTGAGYARMWPYGANEPTAWALNFANDNIGDTGTFAINTAGVKDFQVKVAGHSTHIVIDVQGYFAPPMSAYVSSSGVLQTRQSRAVSAHRLGTGSYEVEFDRDISTCIYVGTVYTAGQIFVQRSLTKANFVNVGTASPNGSQADTAFQVVITC
jgi:hypothetical protein